MKSGCSEDWQRIFEIGTSKLILLLVCVTPTFKAGPSIYQEWSVALCGRWEGDCRVSEL